MNRGTVVAATLAVLALGAGGAVLTVATRGRASPVGTSKPAPAGAREIRAEGRVVTYPGHQASLSAEAAGTIRSVRVQEGDRVKKGDVLVEYRRDEQVAALSEALARVGEADTELKYASAEAKRAHALAAASAIPEQAEERSLEERNAARARRRAAGAASQRIVAGLAKLKVVSPLDGTILARTIEPGETVAPGAPLFLVADLSALRVEAEIDEFDAMRIKLGAEVTISVDGFVGESWQGHVVEIPNAMVGRRIRPQDPARPTDSRVLLVKVTLPLGTQLKLGQRVNLSVAVETAP